MGFYGDSMVGLMGFYGVLLGCTTVWKWVRWDRANKITFDRHLWVYRHLQDVAGMQHFDLVFTLYLCIFCGSDRSSVEKYIEKQWKTNVHCIWILYICIYNILFICACICIHSHPGVYGKFKESILRWGYVWKSHILSTPEWKKHIWGDIPKKTIVSRSVKCHSFPR